MWKYVPQHSKILYILNNNRPINYSWWRFFSPYRTPFPLKFHTNYSRDNLIFFFPTELVDQRTRWRSETTRLTQTGCARPCAGRTRSCNPTTSRWNAADSTCSPSPVCGPVSNDRWSSGRGRVAKCTWTRTVSVTAWWTPKREN